MQDPSSREAAPYAPPASPFSLSAPESQGTGRSFSGWPWLFGCGGCLAVLLIGALLLGGLGYLGVNVFAEQVANAVRDNPVIQEHLGSLEELELAFSASIASEGMDEFVFDAVGSKGTGVLRVESITDESGNEQVVAGSLRLPNGEVYDLFPNVEAEAEEN